MGNLGTLLMLLISVVERYNIGDCGRQPRRLRAEGGGGGERQKNN